MGRATNEAREELTAALDAAEDVNIDVARELFAAARQISASTQLSGALADSAAPATAREAVVTAIFAPVVSATTTALLAAAVRLRWSAAEDLIDGVEELAIRAAASTSSADIDDELFEFSRVVAAEPDLELALGSRLGDAAAKGELITKLLSGRVSAATELIAASLVRHSRARRVRQLLSRAIRIVADQRGRTVATVVAAAPLSADQALRLSEMLSRRYGNRVSLNTVIDPSVVGGLRVQIADDVIDMSVSARLAALRQRLAG